MPAKFDWKAEDEQGWGDIESQGRPARRGWRPSRRLQRIVIVLILVAAAVLIASGQIVRLLDGRTRDKELEVLSGHQLVLDAAAGSDGDLMSGLIFDEMQEWTSAQILAVEQGLMLERGPFDIHLVGDGEPVATEVDVDPNLAQAEVMMTLRYQVGADERRPDVIELRHVLTYRYDVDRWLLDRPADDFWGPWMSTAGRYFTLNYPGRDADLSQRLAADLESVLGQACHSVEDMNCEDDLHLEVNLVADPAAIIAMSNPFWRLLGGPNIELPTPTLMGYPADESAYRAIFRAYADRVVSRLIAEQTDLEQVSQPLLGAVIVDRILEQMGLLSWSSTSDGTTVAAASNAGEAPYLTGDVMYREVQALWNRNVPLMTEPGDNSAETFMALVDFLADDWSEKPDVEMLRLLVHAGNLQEWLAALNPEASGTAFISSWDRYVAETYSLPEPTSRFNESILLIREDGAL